MLPRTLLLTLFAISLLGAEPEKLTKLRGNYESAMTKATAPIQKTYISELEKLKIEFTKSGDLESALAVDAELKTMSTQPGVPTAENKGTPKPATPESKVSPALTGIAGKSGQSKKVFRELAGSNWSTTWSNMTLVLEPDGTMRFSNPAQKGWWSVSENGELLIKETEGGTPRNATLSPKFDHFNFPFGGAKPFTRANTPKP